MTAPRWRRFDPTEAYFAYELERVFVGLRVPDVAALRRAVAELARVNPAIFRRTDMERRRWRPFTPEELRRAPGLLVGTSDVADPAAVLAQMTESPLDGVNFRLTVGRSWVGLKASHAALFDGLSAFMMLAGVLPPGAQPRPVRVIPVWRRDAILAGYVVTHPATVRAALAHDARRKSRHYVPAPPLPSDPPALTHVHSPDGMSAALRSLRDEHWPGASIGSVLLAGVRAGLARTGIVSHPGAEVLFDVRRYLPSSAPLFGNWAAGVFLEPEDDYCPSSVAAAVQDALSSGLPVAAMAAGRVIGRRRRAETLDRPVPAPYGMARLSFSYMGPHTLLRELPWRTDIPTYVLDRTRPATAEALTVAAKEIGGYFSLSVSHYESTWPSAAVQEGLEAFVHDPRGVIEGAAHDVAVRNRRASR